MAMKEFEEFKARKQAIKKQAMINKKSLASDYKHKMEDLDLKHEKED